MKLLNFDLMKQPVNWLTVTMMVFIAGILFTMLSRLWNGQTSAA